MSKSKRKPSAKSKSTDPLEASPHTDLSRYHLRLGWWLLALFATLGLVLETLHGFKLQAYVGVDSSIRREMWTLAHAHGTLLSLVHLGLAATLWFGKQQSGRPLLASRLISAASLLMPLGFFLGGWQYYGGDPGLGILLVPIGGLALVVGAILTGVSAK